MRGVARTAAIAGTATAVSNRVSRRQATKWAGDQAQQDAQIQAQAAQQTTAPAPAPAQNDMIAQLEQLAQLKNQGILTEEEFAAKKALILGI
ncbi:MAG: hypothetical protein BMS9Abin25_0389 [Gammaproteobacteria bacterium]|nr:MAG: hypothetical protein BMS9Abin25_0389 [Gammaproteobacteria bacterium]